jgi:glutamate dehydrogenase
LSYQRLRTEQPLSDAELYAKIKRTVPNKHDSQVLESFLIFNKSVNQTTHTDNISSAHFLHFPRGSYQARSEDQFLPADQGRAVVPVGARLLTRCGIPEEAFWDILYHWCVIRRGLSLRYSADVINQSVGSEFRGFHIRFKDVARGGIRIILSKGKE